MMEEDGIYRNFVTVRQQSRGGTAKPEHSKRTSSLGRSVEKATLRPFLRTGLDKGNIVIFKNIVIKR